MFPKLIDRKELNEDFIKKEKKRKEGKMKKGEKTEEITLKKVERDKTFGTYSNM